MDRAYNDMQLAQLYLCMTREICDQLCPPGPQCTVQAILDALSDYILESVNVTIQRKCFYERHQRKGESISVYMLSMREMSQDCEFGDELEGQIKDSVMQTCRPLIFFFEPAPAHFSLQLNKNIDIFMQKKLPIFLSIF